jgi:hypothetical protein
MKKLLVAMRPLTIDTTPNESAGATSGQPKIPNTTTPTAAAIAIRKRIDQVSSIISPANYQTVSG